MGFNLPPGVTVSMIPGNGTGDEASDEIYEAIIAALSETGLSDETLHNIAEKLEPVIERIKSESYDEGRANGINSIKSAVATAKALASFGIHQN